MCFIQLIDNQKKIFAKEFLDSMISKGINFVSFSQTIKNNFIYTSELLRLDVYKFFMHPSFDYSTLDQIKKVDNSAVKQFFKPYEFGEAEVITESAKIKNLIIVNEAIKFDIIKKTQNPTEDQMLENIILDSKANDMSAHQKNEFKAKTREEQISFTINQLKNETTNSTKPSRSESEQLINNQITKEFNESNKLTSAFFSNIDITNKLTDPNVL